MMKKRNDPISFQKVLIILLIFSTLLAGCNSDLNGQNSPTDSATDPETFATPLVKTNFIVNTPATLNEGERVILEVLDEVTGLPYNSRLYEMTQVTEQQFNLTVSFQTGSVVKYRYVRLGSAITPEATAAGEAVRYRLLYVSGEETVSDLLQGWQGDSVPTETGSLSGVLVDAATQQPAADILISAAGHLTFTDANGRYTLDGIIPGVHNVVFYALDGKYQPYQQGAAIVSGLTTPADVALIPQPVVEVTLHVTTPNDALGVPIYLAGNLIQLGNTFSDLPGGMSLKPKRMPLLTAQADGTFSVTLDLYAGTDLRYKFTLGDGYWNAEQQAAGGFNIRQLIVPDHAVTLDLTIASWRTPGFEPVTFNVTIPRDTSPSDEKYIQFKAGDWAEPLPLWPLGNGNYLYIVFSPLSAATPLPYRFCRNEDCSRALNAEALTTETAVQPSTTAQSVSVTLTDWQNWRVITQPTEVAAATIPVKGTAYHTVVELSSEMAPSWRVYAPLGISTLAEIGAQTVIISSRWFISSDRTQLAPEIGATPFKADLMALLESIRAMGLEGGLFPQMGASGSISDFWSSQSHTEGWWQVWFDSYRQFILNYAQIAAETQVGWLVIGGKEVLPAFPGGVYADGSESDVPESLNEEWMQLIADIRTVYSGKLVWATNAQISMDPLPGFIDLVDELYITVDAPLASSGTPPLDALSAGFSAVVDSQVYEVYLAIGKPITVALAYPSIENAALGCTLLDEWCSNDGVFLADEVAGQNVNLDTQVAIYNAVFPILANRDWIEGISIRGYDPTVAVLDGASSVAGKPAQDVIWYWFSGLTPE